jgi:hypothetical protein
MVSQIGSSWQGRLKDRNECDNAYAGSSERLEVRVTPQVDPNTVNHEPNVHAALRTPDEMLRQLLAQRVIAKNKGAEIQGARRAVDQGQQCSARMTAVFMQLKKIIRGR